MIFLKTLLSLLIIAIALCWYLLEVYWKNPKGVVVWTVPLAIVMTTLVAIGTIWTNL